MTARRASAAASSMCNVSGCNLLVTGGGGILRPLPAGGGDGGVRLLRGLEC